MWVCVDSFKTTLLDNLPTSFPPNPAPTQPQLAAAAIQEEEEEEEEEEEKEQALPLPGRVGVSEEHESSKTSTHARTLVGEGVEPARPIRSVFLLFIRAALGEEDPEATALRELLGPSYWDGHVALYHEDFARRGLLSVPRDRPPFAPDGGVTEDGAKILLEPPNSGVEQAEAWHLSGALKEAARVPGYTL